MFPELLSIGGFTLYTYGLMLAAAYLAAIALTVWRAGKVGLDKKIMMDLSIILLVSAILGAKLFYVLANLNDMMADPSRLWGVLRAGGSFQGGLIVATIVGVSFLIWKKQPIWTVADVIAPAIALGQGIGRIGCFAVGCCYGVADENLPWAVVFPQGSMGPVGIPVHPVQLYESMLMVFAFLFLTWFWSRKKFEGQVFWVYVIIYAIVRGGITEWFRGDLPNVIYNLHAPHLIAIVTFVIGIGAYFFLQAKAKNTSKT